MKINHNESVTANAIPQKLLWTLLNMEEAQEWNGSCNAPATARSGNRRVETLPTGREAKMKH